LRGEMPQANYPRDFPNLQGRFRRTSEPDYYNCIAHVVGDRTRKWWPGVYHPVWSLDYWPAAAPQGETLAAFAAALGTVGYGPCADGSLEDACEKAALYALDNGEITHAALQQADGTWVSKLGSDEDIEHPLDGLEGGVFGRVVAFFKRPRGLPAPATPAQPAAP
jgi:hypothetical protein